ncbi:RHS repeat-associated core domain-containing protein [Sedimentibacter sp. zth1]|uniref:RHS repeat domain-containing protein n=1 Tax=Sedimentibacter sp. zth1 TaxID=2816908 RepID=UPI001F5EA7BA
MTDSTGTTTRVYDEQNRVTAKTVPVIGQTIYQYDIPSNISGYIVEKTTDPKGNISEKTYDEVGRLYSVKTGDKITKYTYYTNGNRKSIIYPEGTKETYTYYKDNKVKKLRNLKSDGTVLQSYTYTYDAAENQTSKTTNDGTTIYEYDSLNRLEKVTEPNGKITSYSFDKAGNRKTEIVAAGENLTGTSYIYNEQNRLISAETKLSDKKTEKTIYKYDNNGNLKSKIKSTMKITDANTPTDIQNMPSFGLEIVKNTDQGTGSNDVTLYSYDNFNRLVMLKEGSTTSTYNYNAEDYRVEKTVENNTTLYLYEADKVILETDSTGNQLAKNVYGTTLLYRLVEENGTSEEYYYMYNAHGDVTALISPNGEVKGTYDYDAFGNIISQTGDVNNNITYAGYQYDKETDLYYLNARYYDSKIARFITEDTYTGNPNDPLSLNVYTYCHNEPIMYTDPTGHWEEGDSDRSDEAQAQIVEATNEYIEAKKRGDTEAMEAAHQKAEDARGGNIYRNKSLTKKELREKIASVTSSKYVSSAAVQDLNQSNIAFITKKPTNGTEISMQEEFLKSINNVRLNSNISDPNLNRTLFKNIGSLNTLAQCYSVNKNIDTNWLLCMYIRQFNSAYCINKWDLAGGKIDYDFINYVETQNPKVAEYFKHASDGNSMFITDADYNKIEITHLAATLTGLIYKSNLNDGYNTKTKLASKFMPEYHIDDLSGWAGDLQTLMLEIKVKTSNSNNSIEISNEFNKLIGNDNSSFSMTDLYADVDAVNIYQKINPSTSIALLMKKFYNQIPNSRFRFTNFVTNLVGSDNRNSFREKVNKYTNDSYYGIGWPLLKGEKFTYNQSITIRNNYINFIFNMLENEK